MTEAISLTILNLKEEECYKNLQIILPLNLIVSLFFYTEDTNVLAIDMENDASSVDMDTPTSEFFTVDTA